MTPQCEEAPFTVKKLAEKNFISTIVSKNK
jgi:hypothetical protein